MSDVSARDPGLTAAQAAASDASQGGAAEPDTASLAGGVEPRAPEPEAQAAEHGTVRADAGLEPGLDPQVAATTSAQEVAPEIPADPSSPVALLQALARALPPDAIDELWIFPARRSGATQSTVIVASAFGPAAPPVAVVEPDAPDFRRDAEPDVGPGTEDADRRRIITARFTVSREPRSRVELRHELAEHGSAPSERVARVVDGVLRRLDDDPAPPRYARIAGDPQRWGALLRDLASDAG